RRSGLPRSRATSVPTSARSAASLAGSRGPASKRACAARWPSTANTRGITGKPLLTPKRGEGSFFWDPLMQVPFFDLSRQYRLIREEIDAAVRRTLESGWDILGEELAAVEREFAAHCGSRHARGRGSGPGALHPALPA